MPKERSINPVAAQHKADKRATIKKSKAQQQTQRNERLAKRNPDRLQRQVDELKELEASGKARPKDKETLAHLEKELRAIVKARDVLGDKAPVFKQHHSSRRENDSQNHTLGKRRREQSDQEDEEEPTDDEARHIPMPEDTPPPIPRARRPKQPEELAENKAKPVAQTVYTAEPQLRDLSKEARRFVPSVVASNINKITAPEAGRLLEPEELDRLEEAGYGAARRVDTEGGTEGEVEQREQGLRRVQVDDVVDQDG